MDKMIHADEFRFRILVTDQCDKDCHFCLNDFQPKGKQFVHAWDVVDALRAYGQFMRFKGEQSIVTFSGGEPGLHPLLGYMVSHAAFYCDIVKIVTNGKALGEVHMPYVNTWHVGVTKKDQNIVQWSNLVKNMMIQIVVTDKMELERLMDLVAYYRSYNLPVKLFTDFFDQRKQKLRNKVLTVQEKFGKDAVCTRFTGNQVNRGSACSGCKEDCVTLKALWYFPDGSSSTCPQGFREKYDHDSWDETMEVAYEAHKKGNLL